MLVFIVPPLLYIVSEALDGKHSSDLSLEQVHDGILAGVPDGAEETVKVASQGHLDETEGEHGRDDTLSELESPSAVVESVVGRVPAGMVVLVTGEEDLKSF
jgi:hypothetical protein